MSISSQPCYKKLVYTKQIDNNSDNAGQPVTTALVLGSVLQKEVGKRLLYCKSSCGLSTLVFTWKVFLSKCCTCVLLSYWVMHGYFTLYKLTWNCGTVLWTVTSCQLAVVTWGEHALLVAQDICNDPSVRRSSLNFSMPADPVNVEKVCGSNFAGFYYVWWSICFAAAGWASVKSSRKVKSLCSLSLIQMPKEGQELLLQKCIPQALSLLLPGEANHFFSSYTISAEGCSSC